MFSISTAAPSRLAPITPSSDTTGMAALRST
jgi:hypothetical protein